MKNKKNSKLDRVEVDGFRFLMVREGDNKGDSGHLLVSLDPKTGKPSGKSGEIVVGSCVRCGSIYARSYSAQDYWTTTPVEEILEVSPDKTTVKFRTRNSVYTVKGD